MKTIKASGIPNLQEALEFQRETSKAVVKVMTMIAFAVMILALLVVGIIYRPSVAPEFSKAAFAVAFLVGGLAITIGTLAYVVPARQTKRAYEEGSPPYLPMELEIDDEEIRVAGETANYTMKWEYFIKRSHTPNTIVLLGQNNDGVYASRSTFESQADWEMFLLKAGNRVSE